MEQLDTNTSKMKIVAMIVALIALIALIAGLSLAIFEYAGLGENNNKTTTGTLIMEIDETGTDSIELLDAYPLDDEDGMLQTPYKFTIRNQGTLKAKYRLRLIKDETLYPGGVFGNADSSHIKYGFQKGEDEPIIDFVDSNDGVLITDEILEGNGDNQEYSIRVWIDSEEDIPAEFFQEHTLEFHGKIQLEAIQPNRSNYTTG